MTPTQFEMLAVIHELEMSGEVKSLFKVSAWALMSYGYSWRVLGWLERDGLVEVERNGSGVPLKIRTTKKGQSAILERRSTRQGALWESR